MAKHNDIGAWGEQLARNYLRANGYTVMEKNLHIQHKEIDIIATKDDRIIFVEVKTRTTDFMDPLEAVDARKIRFICRAADQFMRAHDTPHEPQFDIIVIVGTPTTTHTLTHYEDAFLPPLQGR